MQIFLAVIAGFLLGVLAMALLEADEVVELHDWQQLDAPEEGRYL